MSFTPLLGFISEQDRTKDQNDAHEAVLASSPHFAIVGGRTLAKGEKVDLTLMWSDSRVKTDVGFEFLRFHQNTGSCVGASGGNVVFTLGAVQRCLPTGATKAFIPYWLFNYGRGRQAAGMRGQGDGSIVSIHGKQVAKDGVLVDQGSTMPDFQQKDGLEVSSAIEYQWSDGRISEPYVSVSIEHPVGTIAPANSPEEIAQGIINGYPYHFGNNYYVGRGSIKGTGKDAYVSGKFDTYGPHATAFLGVWEHPTDGRLFKYQNNWPKSVYPADPNGSGSPCSLWVTEAEVVRMLNSLGGKNEGFLYSHLNWFPAQPELLDYVY